jgi:hypothetical protein
MSKKPDQIDAFFVKLFRNVKFYVLLAVFAISFLIWASLPSWEEKNSKRINDQINGINDEVEHSPLEAWRRWKKLQFDLHGQTIKSETLNIKINELELRMNEIDPMIQEEFQRIEEERKEALRRRNKIKSEQQAREQQHKNPSVKVTSTEFGDKWPFTVNEGVISKEVLEVGGKKYAILTFITEGKVYALNGFAASRIKQRGYLEIEAIWKDNPKIKGAKINIWPIIERGLALEK